MIATLRAADVYSYGATLWHLASGRVPNEGVRLDASIGGLDDALVAQLVACCCQPDPADRPNMGDVLRLLNGVLWSDIRAQRNVARALFLALSVAAVFVIWTAANGSSSAS